MDVNIEKINKEGAIQDDLGFILWKLESIENSYPYYKSIIKREQKLVVPKGRFFQKRTPLVEVHQLLL